MSYWVRANPTLMAKVNAEEGFASKDGSLKIFNAKKYAALKGKDFPGGDDGFYIIVGDGSDGVKDYVFYNGSKNAHGLPREMTEYTLTKADAGSTEGILDMTTGGHVNFVREKFEVKEGDLENLLYKLEWKKSEFDLVSDVALGGGAASSASTLTQPDSEIVERLDKAFGGREALMAFAREKEGRDAKAAADEERRHAISQLKKEHPLASLEELEERLLFSGEYLSIRSQLNSFMRHLSASLAGEGFASRDGSLKISNKSGCFTISIKNDLDHDAKEYAFHRAFKGMEGVMGYPTFLPLELSEYVLSIENHPDVPRFGESFTNPSVFRKKYMVPQEEISTLLHNLNEKQEEITLESNVALGGGGGAASSVARRAPSPSAEPSEAQSVAGDRQQGGAGGVGK